MSRIPRRYLVDTIEADLSEKMVFISGPRQMGKTTLALQLVGATGPARGESDG